MPTTVLIPVNRLDRAKGRLAALLEPEERAELVRRSLAAGLGAVEDAGMEAVVLTSDEAVEAEVPAGVRVLGEDPGLGGLSPQIERAAGLLGVEELLILHADLPLVTAEALRALVAQAPPAPSATLVRPGDGGTNAMLLRPPGRFPLAYGRGSGDLHEAAARQGAGVAVRRADAPALALDLDTPADVASAAVDGGGAGDGRRVATWSRSASKGGRRSERGRGQAGSAPRRKVGPSSSKSQASGKARLSQNSTASRPSIASAAQTLIARPCPTAMVVPSGPQCSASALETRRSTSSRGSQPGAEPDRRYSRAAAR